MLSLQQAKNNYPGICKLSLHLDLNPEGNTNINKPENKKQGPLALS